MSSYACCRAISNRPKRSGTRTRKNGPRPTTGWRRLLDGAAWLVPGGILALLPKCPACLAAYFVLGSGIGMSVSTATYLRAGLVVLCVASLSYFAVSQGRRFLASRTLTIQKSCQ